MATIYGISAVLLWGGLALLGSLTTDIPAFQLLFMCFVISTGIMFVKRGLNKEPLFTLPALSLSGWLIGIVGLFGFHFFYFTALKLAPAIEVSLIVYLWPLMLTVFVAKAGRRWRAFTGGILGFTGIGFVILNKPVADVTTASVAMNQMEPVLGYMFALCCALIWSGYSWYLSRTLGQSDDIGWLSLMVAALALGAHLLLEPSQWHWSAIEWFGVLLLGLGPVGGAFYLWDLGMKKGNRTLLASFSFAAPLITAISLALAGLNPWSLDIVVALALVMLGAWVANRTPESEMESQAVNAPRSS